MSRRSAGAKCPGGWRGSVLAKLFLGLALLAGPARLRAQGATGGGDLAGVLGQGSGTEVGVVPGPVPVVPGLPLGISLAQVLAKVRAAQDLTRSEFMLYLLAIEGLPENRTRVAGSYARTSREALPARAWAMIVSKLHDTQYGSQGKHDNDRGVRIGFDIPYLGINLFLNGSENLGWERIEVLSLRTPKYVILDDGRRLDVAHSYAGIGALVMRDGEVAGTLMGRVNTDWGDTLQEAEDTRRSIFTLVRGIFSPNPGVLAEGSQQWGQREARNPPDQVLGDELGNEARDFLQDRRDADLSAAYTYGFERIGP